MGSSEFLGSVDALWIASGLFALMLLVNEIGFLRGRAVVRASPEAADVGKSQMDSALSLLLGLFLAFSFSMAAGRYENRQDLVIAEANAIGTAYLRCDVMADANRESCRQQFRDYTDLRIKLFETDGSLGELRALVTQSERLQASLWTMMAQAAREAPSTNTSLNLQAMNEVIDRHGERIAAYRRHVPAVVTVMLLGLCVIWAAANGFALGTANRRSPLGWTAFAVLISIVIYIIFDFDRQYAGLIRLDASRSLIDLRASMN